MEIGDEDFNKSESFFSFRFLQLMHDTQLKDVTTKNYFLYLFYQMYLNMSIMK